MKVVAIVQARMGSARLPGKVMIDIAGKPMLEHVIERLKKCRRLDEIIIATSDTPEDEVLSKFSKKKGYKLSVGSVHDVLSRYLKAAREAGADYVVRITADCPLIDPEIVDKVIEKHLSSRDVDYTSNVWPMTFPRGFDTEVFSMEVLEKTARLAKKDYHREHVTIFIRENPEIFSLQNVEAEGNLRRPDLRLTVDTMEDLQLIRQIYSELYDGTNVFGVKEIVGLFERKPELVKINIHIKHKTETEVDARYFKRD